MAESFVQIPSEVGNQGKKMRTVTSVKGGETVHEHVVEVSNLETDALTDTQLRATAVPVSLASVPSHPVTNAGTFATQVDGSALTALQKIDDIVDGSGVNISKIAGVVPLILSTGQLRVVSRDYFSAMAEGDITGHTPWSKIGYREASTSGVEVAMSPWLSAAEYVFPAAQTTMTLVSDSVNDATAGTGAQVITVYYLDGTYAEKSVDVIPSGNVSTKVDIAADMFRIQNVRVKTAGVLNATAGNISIQLKASPYTTYGYIRAGKTRARQCIWTVPLGKTLYVTSIAFSASNQGSTKYARFTTKATYDEKSGLVLRPELFMPFNEVGLMNTSYYRELIPPTKLPATTDLKVVCATNDTGSIVTCTLRGWTE